MATVSTVEYSVLINGIPQGHILPERGLRQGDPLSPYLYILCADVLSHMIEANTKSGKIRGIKIGNGVPAITYLLFADDSLFFCQANNRNCKALKQVFKTYEVWSGQEINPIKSTITFGTRIPGDLQVRLKNILGICKQGGGGKYLGLPEQFGRKKKDMFESIINRVHTRTSHWSANFLSQAGKEVLIKSVGVAMPVYSMSCFKLPTKITDEISTILMRFWWDKGDRNKGIPWVAWKRLQFSKRDGGLGFRDLSKFNDALLAKQAWRLLKHPNTLFARIMKARYYKDTTVLEAKHCKNESYGWCSIITGLNLLNKGIRHLIGDGHSTRLYKDQWLPSFPPRAVQCQEYQDDRLVKDRISISGTSKSWNMPIVEELLNVEERSLLSTIYLPQCLKPDRTIWCYDKLGEYTVKSGYWLAFQENIQNNPNYSIPHGDPVLKDQIWKLQIMPKIKHFLWRTASKALATATRLTTRGVKIDKTCQRCCSAPETINHTLFTCPISLMIWRISQLPLQPLDLHDDNCDDQLASLLAYQNINGLTTCQKLLPFWLLWRIWKSRNNLIFRKQMTSPVIVVQQAIADVQEWITSLESTIQRVSTTVITPYTTNRPWQRPTLGYHKCNFDASYDHHTKLSIAGWVIRGHYGDVYSWGSAALGTSTSPLEAEAKALLMAIQQSWCLGLDHLVFEGDCKILIDILNGSEMNFNIESICWDIFRWSAKFKDCKFLFTRRQNNSVAHVLASKEPANLIFYSSRLYPPPWLDKQLYSDFVKSC